MWDVFVNLVFAVFLAIYFYSLSKVHLYDSNKKHGNFFLRGGLSSISILVLKKGGKKTIWEDIFPR